MLLLITGSIDGTSDRIVAQYGDGVFRLNYDLWKDYKISFTPDGWEIINPAGHSIDSNTVSKVFWWKAFQYYVIDDDKMVSSEVRYILKELYGWCSLRGMAKGNFIDWHNRYGKMNILGIAKKYFLIPETLVTIGKHNIEYLKSDDIVAKSLSSEISSDNTVLLTTQVRAEQLDPCYPWYLQSKIDSGWDVTIFQCGKKLYPFRRSRAKLAGLDWRASQDFDLSKKEWLPFEVSDGDTKNLLCLSNDLNVDFGRYDFMTDTQGQLCFLEFNASGQWVFLDFHNEYGLLECVVDWLKTK